MIHYIQLVKDKLEKLKQESKKDLTVSQLFHIIRNEWLDNQSGVSKKICPYSSFRDKISIDDGIIVKDQQ